MRKKEITIGDTLRLFRDVKIIRIVNCYYSTVWCGKIDSVPQKYLNLSDFKLSFCSFDDCTFHLSVESSVPIEKTVVDVLKDFCAEKTNFLRIYDRNNRSIWQGYFSDIVDPYNNLHVFGFEKASDIFHNTYWWFVCDSKEERNEQKRNNDR